MKRIFTFTLSLLLSLYLLPTYAANPAIEEIAALRALSDSLHNVGKSDSAIIIGEKAIMLAEKSGDKIQIVGTNSGQGVYLRSVGRIDDALKCYGKALDIVTSPGFRKNLDQEAIEEIASLYINLSVLNIDMQHKEEAKTNALQAAEWTGRSKDPGFKSMVFGVVGSVLTGVGDLENALKYQSEAYGNALKSEDKEAAFRASAYTMLISDRLGDERGAAEWRGKCQDLLPQVSSIMARLVYYQAECSIKMKHDDMRGALGWFEKIVGMDGIDNLPFIKFDAYNNMHVVYADLKDYEKAYTILLKSNELRDSLWQQEKAESLRDLTVKYETKEAQLALAQSEAIRSRILMWLFAAIGLLLIAAFCFMIYAGKMRRRRLQSELEYANLKADSIRQMTAQYIEGLETERTRMAKELHDGVCNDLLAIKMNMVDAGSIESSERMIDKCRESVRRISHELMPPEFSYATVDEVMKLFIINQQKANADITMTFETNRPSIDWNSLPDHVALELYRIMQEAVGNAIKHSGAHKIEVSLLKNDEEIQLKIRDNGRFKPASQKGIGMESIRKRANMIKGTLEIGSGEEGTEINCKIKSNPDIITPEI